MRGQLSAEMLILIVVILAIVAIAGSQLLGTAKKTGADIENQSGRINDLASEAMKGQEGSFCIDEEDCMEGLGCDKHRCS